MVNHVIRSYSDWVNVAGTDLEVNDTVALGTDIEMNNGSFPVIILDDSSLIFDGNHNTITIPSTSEKSGLFRLSGGTIQNLIVDGSGGSYDINASPRQSLLTEGNILNTYGNITSCTFQNANFTNYLGIASHRFGNDSQSQSIISRCKFLGLTGNATQAACIAYDCRNVKIANCYSTSALCILGDANNDPIDI
jgi:hypothetical protein